MTVLITGFEPFADNAINPSYEAVRRLPDQICGAAVEKRCLPVVFGKAADLLEREIEKICPDIVICTGLAGGRSAITPESVAVNLMDARIPDNEGQQPRKQKILEDGEKELYASLPISLMLDCLREARIPAQQSDSAGPFVCNEVFYRLMKMTEGSRILAGFVHIPYITGMGKGKPEMKLEDVIRGLEICVGAAVRSLILKA